MKKILFLLFFGLFSFNNSLFAVDIELDGTIQTISGTDCQTATYRLGTEASYQGEALDLIVKVTHEDNEYEDGNCVGISSNVLSFRIKDRDNFGTAASVDIKVTVVKKNTMTPLVVDQLNVTNFDLDSSPPYADTDDVYYKNPSKVYLSENSNVTEHTGYYGTYTTRLEGQTTGNCNDSATLTTLECRAGVIYNDTSSFYAQVKNDNAYSNYSNTPSAHRLIQFSFEVKDLTPLLTTTEISCDAKNYSTSNNLWIEGSTPNGYSDNLDISKTIKVKDAETIKVALSGETEDGYDWIYIYDENGNQIKRVSGNLNNIAPFSINGSEVTIRLESDGSVTKSGVTIEIEGQGCEEEPTVSIVKSAEVIEGNSGDRDIIFKVQLDNPALDGGVNVQVQPHNITANEGEDYSRGSSSIYFAKGEIEKTLIYKIHGDTKVEDNETFSVELHNPQHAFLDEDNKTAIGTIINDDKEIFISIAEDVNITEGDSGTQSLDFTILLNEPAPIGGVSVQIQPHNITANEGEDYSRNSSSISFAEGEKEKIVSYIIKGDTKEEDDETFSVELHNPQHASLDENNKTAIATILDDDGNSECNEMEKTIEVRVSATDDDAEESQSGSVYKNSSDLELVKDGYNQTVGIRFQGIYIPKNSIITKAYIQFSVDETSSESTHLNIYGEDRDNTDEFSSSSHNISQRVKTSAHISWSPEAWTQTHEQGLKQRTPNLQTIIQEIVNRDGWSSGNAVSFIITGSGKRVAESYNGNSDEAPLLHIEYESCDDGNSDGDSTATCYALTDDSNKLYKVSMLPNGNPLPIATFTNISKTFNGEGSAYRASDNKFYAFKGNSDDQGPSDLYTIDIDTGATTKIVDNLINGAVDGAEFYFDPTLNREILYILSGEYNSKLYAFDPTDWSALNGYPRNTNTDLSSLAIDPISGEAYAIDDYNYDNQRPKVYKLNLKTGATTHITTLQNLADAEGLAFASDGNLYIEDEGRDDLNGKRLYKVDLTTGVLTPSAITNANGDIEGLSCNGTQMAIQYPTIRLDGNNSIIEGDSNTSDLTFSVTLNKPAIDDITLSYSITDETTVLGEDYLVESNKSIIIPKDATSANITVKVKGDIEVENNETFLLELTNVNNAIFDSTSIVSRGTIINDDDEAIEPLTCENSAFMFHKEPTDVSQLNLTTGDMTLQSSSLSTTHLNAAGYNKKDNYIWGYDQVKKDGTLLRVGKDEEGVFTSEEFKIDNLEISSYVGDINDDGELYLKKGRDVYVVDLDPSSEDYLTKVRAFTLSQSLNIADWAFNPIDDQLYAVTKETNKLYKINPNDGTVSFVRNTEVTENSPFGASFFDKHGNFYFYSNGTGNIYKIDTQSSSVASLFSHASIVAKNDGAMCSDIEIAEPAHLYIDGDKSITEGNSSTQNLTFTISLNKLVDNSISFDYQFFDGNSSNLMENATSPSDYTHTGLQHVVFPSNSTTYPISVTIKGDIKIEGNEQFTLLITNIQGATGSDGNHTQSEIRAIGTIINDDLAISVGTLEDLDEDNDGILDEIEYGEYPNLIQNPSFEADNFSNATLFPNAETSMNGTFFNYSHNNNKITGWSYEGGVDGIIEKDGIIEGMLHQPTPHGKQYIDLQGDKRFFPPFPMSSKNKNRLYQTISTVPGKKYRFSFWLRAKENLMSTMIFGRTTLNVQVSDPINNSVLSNRNFNEISKTMFPFPLFNQDSYDWTKNEIFFEATSTETTISFATDRAMISFMVDVDIDMVSVKEVVDTDNDGIPDFLDLDSDNDGIPDTIETQTTQNYIKPTSIFDIHGVDLAFNGGFTPVDTDEDNISDYLDLDSDNDGIDDKTESGLEYNDNTSVGVNGLSNTLEHNDTYQDINGIAFDNLIFNLKDSDNDVTDNGLTAAPMGKDFDYRDNTESLPLIYISDESILEGNSSTKTLDFTVSIDKIALGEGISFNYQVFDGNVTIAGADATAPSDYTLVNGLGELTGNTQIYTISVPIKGDTELEEDESFSVVLSNIHGADIGDIMAIGTIINDDIEIPEENSTDLDKDNDGILDALEYGTCSTGVETLMSFDDFGQGGRTTTPYTTYCYEDGDGYSTCQDEKGIAYWPGSIHTNDGEYTVVQHPKPDASDFSSWSTQGDHTGNENGRMMVVNASLQADEFYRRSYTVIPNAGMTVDLWILNVVNQGANIILPDISFRLEDMSGNQIGEIINTGEIPENGIWNHYTLSINPENNSEIQIVLANNADGGSGNDLALDDIRITQVFCDSDGDGIADYLDLDSDNDGIPDNIEAQTTQDYIKPNKEFTEEGVDTAYMNESMNGLTPIDTDGDGIKDYLDLDSDNDGIYDIDESGLGNNDTDNDHRTDANVGINGLDNGATFENADDYNDTNGLAYEGDEFKLLDSDDDMNRDGSNASPMKTDFDYRDNLGKTSLTITDAKVLEGDEGTTQLTFTVSIESEPDRDISFNYRIIDGNNNDTTLNAIAPSDYVGDEGSGTISSSSLTYEITVNINGDKSVENNEEFIVVLENILGANITKDSAIGTILNDDLPDIRVERINSGEISDINSLERKEFYTQIAGKDFDYSILSYSLEEAYVLSDVTLKVELVDNNSSIPDDKIYGSHYVYIDNLSRKDILDAIDLKINRATRYASFRLSYLLDENSSMVHGKYDNEEEYNSVKELDNREKTATSDYFAIRPAGYRIKIDDIDADNQTVTYATNNNTQNQELKFASEYNYEIKANAVTYEEANITTYQNLNSNELNTTLIFDASKTTRCADSNDSEKNYSFKQGYLDNHFSHNNVGNYALHMRDINWTYVDQNKQSVGCILNSSSNEADASGRFGCNIDSDEGANFSDIKMSFQPYKFEFNDTELVNINGNGKDYLYMSDLTRSQEMGLKLHSTLIAKGKNDTTLTNFTQGCVATEVKLTSTFTVVSEEGNYTSNQNFELHSTKGTLVMPQNILRVNDDNSTELAPFNNLVLSKDSFLDIHEGNSTIDILYNMQKNFNDSTNPITVNFISLEANATGAKAIMKKEEVTPKGKGDIDNGLRTFYFARIASKMKSFPETNKPIIQTPLYVEIYCKILGNRAWCDNTMNLENIGRNSENTDRGWYLAKEHNRTVDGRVNRLVSDNDHITPLHTNPIADFTDGIIDNIETGYTEEAIEGTYKAEIAIDSDVWLRFNTKNIIGMPEGTSSYFVTFKGIADTTGVGLKGYMLPRRPQVERNGKMSW